MRRFFGWILLMLLAATLSLAQQTAPQEQQKLPEKSDKKKDKKKKATPADAPESAEFSDRVASMALNDLRDGLEGHSQRLLLSAFDADRMEGYLTFQDQINAFFERYDAFRVHYRIAQSMVEGARGIVLVDFEMEESPRGGAAPPQRKSAQIRFELERGKNGWKIVDFRPREFFS